MSDIDNLKCFDCLLHISTFYFQREYVCEICLILILVDLFDNNLVNYLTFSFQFYFSVKVSIYSIK
jgi:hypothetical protein